MYTLMTVANCRNVMTMKVAFSKQANFIKVMDYLQYSLVWFDTTSSREVYFKQVQPYKLIYMMHKPHQSICLFLKKQKKGMFAGVGVQGFQTSGRL